MFAMQLAGIDVEAVDAARIATVSNALGNQRFGELLTILCVRLQRLSAAIEMLPGDVPDLFSTLHQSRGSAASLGLVGLAQALTEIEAQIARMLGCAGSLPDTARMASIKIAGRALHGYWRAASCAAAHHFSPCGQDQAWRICSK